LRVFLCFSALALLFFAHATRADSFTVDHIEVIGVKKISVGTVFNYLPLNVGEEFDENRSPEIIRELYSTGFFEHIELFRDNNSLIVKVKERPSIAEINIEGNKEIDDEGLDQAFDQMGMTRGKIFNELLLSKLELELQQLYYSLGKYAVKLKADWRKIDDDRVAIDITISEGEPALIRSINITGNRIFDEETLRENFQLEPSDDGWFASDSYSSSKLTADLENLNSFYLDQGYVQFKVDSKQVTISPDRKDINITVNISEGEQFTIKEISMAGNLVVDRAELMALVPFREGEIFSRKKVTKVVDLISRRLGEEGYAFAEVRPIPEINEADNTVSLKYLINPGKKMMVRFIKFFGNNGTRDTVLRREMRQFESEQYSAWKVDRSRTRLQRLNFLASVNIQTVRVEGHDDQLDLEITVTERFSGSFQVGLGYSGVQGAILNIGLQHDNVFGSGNTISITFDNSAASERYGFRYLNPYYTADGISRGFSFSFSKTDAADLNISDYLLDRVSLGMDFGIPLSEFNTFRTDFGVIQNEITVSPLSADEVIQFIIDNSDEYDSSTDPADVEGAIYRSLFSSVSFSHDTRNRRIFAETGALNTIKFELFGGDLDYYKIRYNHKSAIPITDNVTYSFSSRIGYGDSFKETSELPFFEKFLAGGVRSVRGYERNSLGPLDSNGDPFGGNLQVILSSEILFPIEALGSSETFRLGLYFDAGNVFANANEFDSGELRTSVGISAKWFSVIGPLEFSYAETLNDVPGDDVQNFQFALGAAF
jgi:outer membrane protein insertion porin family